MQGIIKSWCVKGQTLGIQNPECWQDSMIDYEGDGGSQEVFTCMRWKYNYFVHISLEEISATLDI